MKFLRSLPQVFCAMGMAFVSAIGLLMAYRFFPMFGMPMTLAVPGLTFSIGIVAPPLLMMRANFLQRQRPENKAICRWGFIFAGVAYAIIAAGGLLLFGTVVEQCSGEHGCDMGGGIFGFFGIAFAIVASITAASYWTLAGRAGRWIADEARSAPQPSRGELYAFSVAYIVVLLGFTGSASGVTFLVLASQLAVSLSLLDALGLVSAVLCWGSAVLLLLFKEKRAVRIAAGALLAAMVAVLVGAGGLAGPAWFFLFVPVAGVYALPPVPAAQWKTRGAG
ncbi:MAG: hypothetical protein F4X98_17115 [Gammaproteobacteria bacterium]|nr:hypothetical protein [Gammaproteobacteria bacterium]